MSRRRKEPDPPAEYVREGLRPGDTIKCAGCDKEHVLKEDKNEKGKVGWAWCDVRSVHLPKTAPVSAWVCETGGWNPSQRCLSRALKRMGRCPGCGLGPRDPDPERPGDPVTSYCNAGEIQHGSICSRCDDALAAGRAALAIRGEVTWHALDTREDSLDL